MFDRKGFINAATSQYAKNGEPIDYEAINSYLESQGAEKITGVEKTILNEVIPKVFAGAGGVAGGIIGLGGGPVAPVTVPSGAGAGGFVGYGAGKVVNENLKKIMGLTSETPQEYTNKALPEASTAGLITGAVADLPYIAKSLWSPFQNIKNTSAAVRKASIGDMSVPSEEAQANILSNLKSSKYYQMNTPEAQQMSQSRLGQYFGGVNPMETVNPTIAGNVGGQSMVAQSPNMSINNMYGYLSPFEQSGRAYSKTGEPGAAAISQGTNLASHAIRDYLTTQIPKTAQVANKVWSTANSIQPVAERLTRIGIPSSIAFILARNWVTGLLKK